MRIIKEGKSKNALVAIAIGDEFCNKFIDGPMKTWLYYCYRFDLSLIIFDSDLISKEHPNWKKATWQKTLIGSKLSKSDLDLNNICYMDTDFIISPIAPNVFDYYNENSIGLVSLRKNLPFEYQKTMRSIAWNRKLYYDSNYPLDSILIGSTRDLYLHNNLPPVDDEACMGLIIFNLNNHSKMFVEIFHKYDKSIESTTGGGDQTHHNYEFQKTGLVQWLDYKFQAIWTHEMASKYDFLYQSPDSFLIEKCIISNLKTNYFLHFAGGWHESKMIDDFNFTEKIVADLNNYQKFMDRTDLKGQPVGVLKPSK